MRRLRGEIAASNCSWVRKLAKIKTEKTNFIFG